MPEPPGGSEPDQVGGGGGGVPVQPPPEFASLQAADVLCVQMHVLVYSANTQLAFLLGLIVSVAEG